MINKKLKIIGAVLLLAAILLFFIVKPMEEILKAHGAKPIASPSPVVVPSPSPAKVQEPVKVLPSKEKQVKV